MNTAKQITRLTEDLAAYWTEPVLELLKDAGLTPLSVESEIQTWHTLNALLQAELRWQRAFRSATTVSLSALRELVFRQAILVLARPAPRELDRSLRQEIRTRPANAIESWLYGQLVREPALRPALKPLSRTDFVPHLRPV
jgi:hypothetical protein